MLALSLVLGGTILALWPNQSDEIAELGAYLFWAGIVVWVVTTVMAWAFSRAPDVR